MKTIIDKKKILLEMDGFAGGASSGGGMVMGTGDGAGGTGSPVGIPGIGNTTSIVNKKIKTKV